MPKHSKKRNISNSSNSSNDQKMKELNEMVYGKPGNDPFSQMVYRHVTNNSDNEERFNRLKDMHGIMLRNDDSDEEKFNNNSQRNQNVVPIPSYKQTNNYNKPYQNKPNYNSYQTNKVNYNKPYQAPNKVNYDKPYQAPNRNNYATLSETEINLLISKESERIGLHQLSFEGLQNLKSEYKQKKQELIQSSQRNYENGNKAESQIDNQMVKIYKLLLDKVYEQLGKIKDENARNKALKQELGIGNQKFGNNYPKNGNNANNHIKGFGNNNFQNFDNYSQQPKINALDEQRIRIKLIKSFV